MFLSHRGLGARWAAWSGAMSLMLLSAGCEPTSITDARDQLQRGPTRDVAFSIPIMRDSFTIRDLLDSASIANGTIDTLTLPSGVFAVALNPRQVNVGVGSRLRFDNVSLAVFQVSVPAGAGPGTVDANGSYAAFSGEPRLLAVDTIEVASGALTFVTRNELPGPLSYTLTLKGFRDALGVDSLTQSGTAPAAPGDGSFTTDTLTFNLANVRIAPASVNAILAGSVNLAGVTAAALDVIQSGTGNIVVQRLTGSLDPVQTPDLTVVTEDSVEIPASDVDFGDFNDAVRDARLNDARIQLTVTNSSQAPLEFSTFTLGVVQLTAAGQVPRDGSGNPVYQTDSLGAITVAVADSGQTTLTVARGATKTITLQAARLVDRIADLVLAQPAKRAGVIGEGSVTVGDGNPSSIVASDFVQMTVMVIVPLDFTIPPTGLKVDTVFVQDGRNLIAADAEDLAQRVQAAIARAVVTNGTPFGVEVVGALLPGSFPSISVDSALRRSDRAELDTIRVNAAPVDAQGRVTQPATTADSTSLTGQEVKVAFGATFTVAVRVRLLPGTGTRGALRSSDTVILNVAGAVRVRTGGS